MTLSEPVLARPDDGTEEAETPDLLAELLEQQRACGAECNAAIAEAFGEITRIAELHPEHAAQALAALDAQLAPLLKDPETGDALFLPDVAAEHQVLSTAEAQAIKRLQTEIKPEQKRTILSALASLPRWVLRNKRLTALLVLTALSLAFGVSAYLNNWQLEATLSQLSEALSLDWATGGTAAEGAKVGEQAIPNTDPLAID